MAYLSKILPLISKLLSADPKSIAGTINPAELLKVVATSALSGGGILAVLTAVAAASGTVFTDPTTAGAVAALISLGIDLYRRFGHGAPVVAKV
jgi:hypothetical protein